MNNAKQIEKKRGRNPPKHNFANLKSQCYFELADAVNLGKISCYEGVGIGVKKMLIEELEQVKRKDMDKDGRVAVVGKDKVKEFLGRSPDISDSVMQRMFFEVCKEQTGFFFG